MPMIVFVVFLLGFAWWTLTRIPKRIRGIAERPTKKSVRNIIRGIWNMLCRWR